MGLESEFWKKNLFRIQVQKGNGSRIRNTGYLGGGWRSDPRWRAAWAPPHPWREPSCSAPAPAASAHQKQRGSSQGEGTSVADPDPPDPGVFGPLDPDPLIRGMDPDPDLASDPSIITQKW